MHRKKKECLQLLQNLERRNSVQSRPRVHDLQEAGKFLPAKSDEGPRGGDESFGRSSDNLVDDRLTFFAPAAKGIHHSSYEFNLGPIESLVVLAVLGFLCVLLGWVVGVVVTVLERAGDCNVYCCGQTVEQSGNVHICWASSRSISQKVRLLQDWLKAC